jgi:general secretion pathway protein L
LEASQNWNLFGYDVRNSVYFLRAGWRDFLWGSESPVMQSVDEPVRVYAKGDQPQAYHSGRMVSVPDIDAVEAQAVLLPDSLVLPKTLTLPLQAEGNIETVVAMEVKANSPFPADDTRFGWRIVDRNDQSIVVQLVICSGSVVMEHVAKERDSHDLQAYEIWALAGDEVIQVGGFGEVPRKARNKVRIIRLGLGLAYCLVVLVLAFAVGTGMKYLELQAVREQQAVTQQRAAEAVALRKELSNAKKRVAAINEILAKNPSPYLELARLSRLLDDQTWLTQVDINGSKIRIDGSSPDAAGVMQKLTDEPSYSSVAAPVGIKRVSTTGLERFVLDITLASAGEES